MSEADKPSNKRKDTFSDFDATVNAFQGRMNRQMKAREEALQEADEATRNRQTRVLEELLKVRKSFRQVEQIDLGDRFNFRLDLDDWEGWPRMSMVLVDSQNPVAEFPQLQATANDRQEDGMLEILYANKKEPETLELGNILNVRKVPSLLKKCVREHLDLVAELIMEEETKIPNEDNEKMPDKAGINEKKETKQPAEDLDVDLFQDNDSGLEETLPEIEDDLTSIDISFD